MSVVGAWLRANGHGDLCPEKSSDSDADTFWGHGFPDTAKPNLSGEIRMVLVGSQGTGKTSLFNRLTGANSATSGGTASCTRFNEWRACLPPFQNVKVGDSPGTASDDVHYDDSFQLREALVRKPVHLIVVVCGLPAVTRLSEVVTTLKPVDKIMRCSTFTLDENGVVVPPTGPRSHTRTRVMLVLTHRDRFSLPRDQWDRYVKGIRVKYDWVGSVVMTDLQVPINNLLACIVAPAACMLARDYNIPMTEFCSRFPISRTLSEQEEMQIVNKLVEFNSGMALALQKLNQVLNERQQLGYAKSSSHVDKVGPVMDCILRFLDDLYERKTLEALAQLEGVCVDDLWAGTDEDINIRRVEKWNAVKSKMGEGYERNKQLVSQAFPSRPIDAIYKKCNHCGIVYVKPTGCDFGTTCGSSKGGADSLPFTYEYMESKSYEILAQSGIGLFEQRAYTLRRAFAQMVATKPQRFYGGVDSGAIVQEHSFDKPCGRNIKWETMIPLTIEELQRHQLVPDGVVYEVTMSETAGVKKDMSIAVKLKTIAEQLDLDSSTPMKTQVAEAYDMLGLDVEPKKNLPQQVDELFRIVVQDDDRAHVDS